MTSTPWFGYAPAERVTGVSDVVLDLTAEHDIDHVSDEQWMDIIAEGKLSRSVGRHNHGTRKGGQSRCGCFLCVEWREEEEAIRVKRVTILPVEDPRHFIHRSEQNLG